MRDGWYGFFMTRTYRYDSLTEFVDQAASTKMDVRGEGWAKSAYRTEFCLSASMPDAIRLSAGWAEGVEKMEKCRTAVSQGVLAARQAVRMREMGPGALSMGPYLAGHPQPYATLHDTSLYRPKRGGKIVKIMLNIVASGGIGTDKLIQRGAGVTALIDGLERSGRRVELVVACANGGGFGRREISPPLLHFVTVKRPDQPLNLPVIAFAASHPSMLRRFIFSLMEQMDESERSLFGVGGGYGSCIEVPASFRQDSIYVGKMMYRDPNFETVDSTRQWVRDQLEAQGVIIK